MEYEIPLAIFFWNVCSGRRSLPRKENIREKMNLLSSFAKGYNVPLLVQNSSSSKVRSNCFRKFGFLSFSPVIVQYVS